MVLGLPEGDDPGCVAASVRSFKISLNDSLWSSPEARAQGLRDLGLAQLGSLGVVDDREFAARLSEQIIRRLIPVLFREVFPGDERCLAAADHCEREGSKAAAEAAADVANAAEAARARARAAYAAYAAHATNAAEAATDAADHYLALAARIALDVLREMGSPGCRLLQPTEEG